MCKIMASLKFSFTVCFEKLNFCTSIWYLKSASFILYVVNTQNVDDFF